MLQCLIQGVLLGGLYAIIGIGMSMVFGIMGLTNLAHGDLMILGTYITMLLTTTSGLPLFLSVIISVVIMAIIGFVVQNCLVNRVLDKGSEPALLVTFGVSIFLSNLILKLFSADYKSIPNSLASTNVLSTKVLSISGIYLFSFIVGLVVIAVLSYIMQKTNFGRSIRATSNDTMAAELMGVNTKRAYSYAMIIAMVTAAIAGALVGSTFTFNPASGTSYLIIAFGVVVIGGMGSIPGTLVAGLVFGLAQVIGGANYGMFISYIVLLVMLAVRPQGLFSK